MQQVSRRSAIGLVAMNALAAAVAGRAQLQQKTTSNQQTQQQQSSPPKLPDIMGNRPGDEVGSTPFGERMRISAEKAHNEDRRKRMMADSDKLLALSTELKEFLEKTTKDELSLDVIRKAAEIEKLAHDVQQRMKN